MKFRVGPLILLMGFFLVSCNSEAEPVNNNPSTEQKDTESHDEHEHSYSSSWSYDKNEHWHECSCGEKKDKAVHTWDDGVVTKEATETEDGEKVYTCTVCKVKKTVTINKQGTITNEGEYSDDDEWGAAHK